MAGFHNPLGAGPSSSLRLVVRGNWRAIPMTGSMWRRSEAGIAEHPTVDGALTILEVDAVGGLVEIGDLAFSGSSGAKGAGGLAKLSEHSIFLFDPRTAGFSSGPSDPFLCPDAYEDNAFCTLDQIECCMPLMHPANWSQQIFFRRLSEELHSTSPSAEKLNEQLTPRKISNRRTKRRKQLTWRLPAKRQSARAIKPCERSSVGQEICLGGPRPWGSPNPPYLSRPSPARRNVGDFPIASKR